jgi:hypothetical protein
MTAAQIAHDAGVDESYVRKLKKTRESTGQADSESRKTSDKVQTKRGLRPKQYRTRKKVEKERRERERQASANDLARCNGQRASRPARRRPSP